MTTHSCENHVEQIWRIKNGGQDAPKALLELAIDCDENAKVLGGGVYSRQIAALLVAMYEHGLDR